MKISRKAAVDISLLVLVNTLWAAQYAAYKIATEKMGPLTVSAWTFLISSVVLFPFLVWDRHNSRANGSAGNPAGAAQLQARPSIWTRRNLSAFFIASVFGLVPGSALLAWGVDRSTASLNCTSTICATIYPGRADDRIALGQSGHCAGGRPNPFNPRPSKYEFLGRPLPGGQYPRASRLPGKLTL